MLINNNSLAKNNLTYKISVNMSIADKISDLKAQDLGYEIEEI